MRTSDHRRWYAALALALWLPAASAAEPAPAPGLGLVEAIELMLANDPNVALVAARLESSRGALLAARGAFDPVVRSSVDQSEVETPLVTGSEEVRTLGTGVGVAKQFRTGLSIEPELGILRTEEPGAVPGAANLGTLSFTIRQPLLRGRGRAVVAAGELFAERELAASGLDLEQATAERILTVAGRYWELEAAEQGLEILRATEESSRELLETTRRLIEADQTPAAELVQLEANLAAKEAARIGGERELFAARQALGREIGLPGDRIAALPLPSDPFPEVRPAEVPPPAASGRFVAEALARRADLRAARERRESLAFLVRAADDARKPQLDLLLVPSYSGLVEGTSADSFFSPLYRNVPGVSSSVALSVAWPTGNSRARGDLLQAQAARRQGELAAELFEKGIGADVPAALDSVSSAALQAEKAAQAVALFERAVENEEKKLRAGSSTLLDVISQRDRLTAARQTLVSSRLALALALARLRFETGTLLATEGEAAEVRYARLTTIPFTGEEEPR